MSDHFKLLEANNAITLTDKNNCADLKHWSLKDKYIRSEQLCLSVNITP